MSIEESNTELDEPTRAILENLATVRDGRAKLKALHGLLEQNRPDLLLDEIELSERLSGASRRGLSIFSEGQWVITERGRDLLQRLSTEPEQRNGDSESALWEGAPFDPGSLSVSTVNDPVMAVLAQIKSGRIFLQPAFQRNFVWDAVRQSRLIESIMLRIPLPAFYLDEMSDNRRQVMDGLQRLSTLDRFCNQKRLQLTGLRYLTQYEKMRFDDLPVSMQQLILEDTRLTLHIVQAQTSDMVRFEVFYRVNTGGLTLTAQEIRHALYQGKATTLLRNLAEHAVFTRVTGNSISALRMDDRDCILRYFAFKLYGYNVFQRGDERNPPRNLDDLLNKTMISLNSYSDVGIETFSAVFLESLEKAALLFGPFAFRKIDYSGQSIHSDGTRDSLHINLAALAKGEVQWKADGRRSPISKPLFEIWTVLLERYRREELRTHHAEIVRRFLDLLADNEFNDAITYTTGSPIMIARRFGRVERLLEEIIR
ncbi:hypothetical protein OSCT_0156 [Oscillochloris trichoides DG-6]|uniref:GmrSD restriction endonucleases N-terminal domain-containing protein n=1 Tax=Oscillochloris trichoides DG-6 TaxID=765420 RepID=E1IA05_9CHLR|nr:DUF262 domain-containing protein [Oscillochloris trichoides]EFO82007.1 hypothetical protein OSCT_0156 [Oscillochloris trichoides DG-6]